MTADGALAMDIFTRRRPYIPDIFINPLLPAGGSKNELIAAANLVDLGPLTSLMLVMPTVDGDGNPISDGIELSISFGDSITMLNLVGPFRSAVPTSASAGQVLNFRYSAMTNSWWNA